MQTSFHNQFFFQEVIQIFQVWLDSFMANGGKIRFVLWWDYFVGVGECSARAKGLTELSIFHKMSTSIRFWIHNSKSSMSSLLRSLKVETIKFKSWICVCCQSFDFRMGVKKARKGRQSRDQNSEEVVYICFYTILWIFQYIQVMLELQLHFHKLAVLLVYININIQVCLHTET